MQLVRVPLTRISKKNVKTTGTSIETDKEAYDLANKLSPNHQVEAKLDGKTIAKIAEHILNTLGLNHANKCVLISTDGAARLSGSY